MTTDDEIATHETPLDVLGLQLAQLRRGPDDAVAYRRLLEAATGANDHDVQAQASEVFATATPDRNASAAAWATAGEARLAAGQIDLALGNFERALALGGSDPRTIDRTLETYLAGGHVAAAVELIDHHLAELERVGASVVRRIAMHERAAGLWQTELARLDRAIEHWQAAWRLDQRRIEPLRAARTIYASIGDDQTVAQLLVSELGLLGAGVEPSVRAERLLELAACRQRTGDLPGAAAALEEAARIDPHHGAAREQLAEIYSAPDFPTDDDQITGAQRASELYADLGRSRLSSHRDETAVTFLRRALGADPYSQAHFDALARALTETERWAELERALHNRQLFVTDPAERAALLRRRIELFEGPLADAPARILALEDLATLEPPRGPASLALRAAYADAHRVPELAARMEIDLSQAPADPDPPLRQALVADLLELASLTRESLGQRDRAAELLHQALSLEPTNAIAMARYQDHFRERRDWRGLADLLEFGLDNARDAGASAEQQILVLEELAQLAELRLGDIPRAVATWERIAALQDPPVVKTQEAIRRLLTRAKMWNELVANLEREAHAATTPADRLAALRRMAQTFRERQLDPRRAMALYEEILTLDATDDASLRALADLYERDGDDRGLTQTLRRQLELDAARLGGDGGAREWPVSKRGERITQLRRLATLCDQRTGDVDGVVYACAGVLELLPHDREAMERMTRVLDKAGDPRLPELLGAHVSGAINPSERAKLQRRLAALHEANGDGDQAMALWQAVLATAPADAEALTALAGHYERLERWADLADVWARLDAGRPPVQAGTPEAAMRIADLERYADLVDGPLDDAERATRAWTRVLELAPQHPRAIAALIIRHRAAGRWQELAACLARQIDGAALIGRPRAIAAALERARLLEERLGVPAEAILQLEHVVARLDARHPEAHAMLRRLHIARGDFANAIRVGERELFFASDVQAKVALGRWIGAACRDQLGDPRRALQAYQRVIELAPDDPDLDDAFDATCALHERLGQTQELEQLLAQRLERERTPDARRARLAQLARVAGHRDGKVAFRWWRQAHDEAPDATSGEALRRLAETHGLWRELLEVLEADRRRAGQQGARGAHTSTLLAWEIADVWERRLQDRPRAIAALVSALAASPQDLSPLSEAERIASDAEEASGPARALWKSVLDAFDTAIAAAAPARRAELHVRRAALYETRTNDPRAAVAEGLAAFAWSPERDDLRPMLTRLAERTRQWQDLLAVDTALIERAASDGLRITALRRKAQLIEDHLKDPPRAFRTHLLAFMIAPEDGETHAHLWRLGRAIGSYTPADAAPRPEPSAATIHGDAAIAGAHADAEAARPRAHVPSRRAGTEELDEQDLARGTAAPGVHATQPLSTDDLLAASASRAGDADFVDELSTYHGDLEELSSALPPPPPRRAGSATTPPPLPARGGRVTTPPPPPRARSASKAGTIPPPLPRKAQAAVRRSPMPSLFLRTFTSPWDEWVFAYAQLPPAIVGTVADKLRRALRVAEIWETGAGDIGRAFEALAEAFALARRLPDELPAVRARLHRMASAHAAHDRLATLYAQLAEASESAADATELLLDVAAIRRDQGQVSEAEAQYRRVLGIVPDHDAARSALEAVYRTGGRWVELAASLEERTDPRLGSAAPAADRPALLRELANLYVRELHRPHDAIDTLERLRGLVPEDLDILRQEAALFGSVGRWSKAVEALGRLIEAAVPGTAPGTVVDARREIARIYEHELELPDRALEATRQLVADAPDDIAGWAALDRLYTGHARWAELSDVLRRRAALEPDPRASAHLLARRGEVLRDWVNNPEEAVAAFRHARTLQPDDATIADHLIGALLACGRAREAAATLEQRITAFTPEGTAGPRGEVAALEVRLAQIRIQHLADPAGARSALERAIAHVPEHPTALALLAQLSSGDDDPITFAQAKVRAAEAATDDDARIDAYMAAGAAYRDRAADPSSARALFEKVLALRPFHADATWAMAGLIERGDPESAIRLLEGRLEEADVAPLERARVLTQLAALARAAGVEPVSERRLIEALAVAPTHVPAVIALADLYGDAARWSELELFLGEFLTLPELATANLPDATLAELHRRRGEAFERLERAEDAYQTLLAADRLQRGHLLIKLGLGENRYRAKRWREAALHLAALAQHPEAVRYPAQVAQALYHAALAEVRSLRPEKAAPLYARALELRPTFGPALQALAEQALEQGQTARAAELLTRQAEASEDPAERLRLFEALGDLALTALGDEAQARVHYEAAVAAAQPIEARHLPLLEKLLERQDLAEDLAGAARTAEWMAAFGVNAGDRTARFLRAARDYAATGDVTRAASCARRAVETSPDDLEALDATAEFEQQLGHHDAIAELLGRALTAKASGLTRAAPDRLARLWHRLGEARLARGDLKQAWPAFDRAVQLAPTSAGATDARRRLLEHLRAQPDEPGRRAQLLEHARAIVQATGAQPDVAAWADELRRQDLPALGRVALEVARGLGHALDVHQTAFLTLHRPAMMQSDEAYRGVLEPEDRRGPLADVDAQEALAAPLAPLFAILAEAANLIWPNLDETLARLGLEPRMRVSASQTGPALAMLPRLAAAVGTGATLIYARDAEAAADLEVWAAATPVIVLGRRLLSAAPSDAELRFTLGRAMELARPEHMVAVGQAPDALATMIAAMVRTFGTDLQRAVVAGWIADDGVQRAHDDQLRSALPVRLRQRAEAALASLAPTALDPRAAVMAIERAADRSGAVLCTDVGVAVSLVRAPERREALVRSIAHPAWPALRARLFAR